MAAFSTTDSRIRPHKKRGFRHRFSDLQVHLFPLLGAMVRAWCGMIHRNVRYDRQGPLFEFIRRKEPCVIALWHQDVFPLMFELFRYTPSYPSLFMVSPGRMGTIGAYFLNIWGIGCVAGSRAANGQEAVERLSHRARETGSAVFVMADGARGPARVARWGAVHIARNTGMPIIAARAWGDNLMILRRTWMRLALPKPWGRAGLMSAQPIFVPASADRPVLEALRRELEKSLNDLADAASEYFRTAEREGTSASRKAD